MGVGLCVGVGVGLGSVVGVGSGVTVGGTVFSCRPERRGPLAVGGGNVAFDQVHLMTVAGIEPRAREPEVGPRQRVHAEVVTVELQRTCGVADVERHVMDVGDAHDATLPRCPREHDRTMRGTMTEPSCLANSARSYISSIVPAVTLR